MRLILASAGRRRRLPLALAACLLLLPAPAVAGMCVLPRPAGGAVSLAWPGALDADAWPARCAEMVDYLGLPPPPWDDLLPGRVEGLLRALHDFGAVLCQGDAQTLACALEPLPVVVQTEVHGALPVALVREEMRRRLFLRPGALVKDLGAELRRQRERLESYLEYEGFFDSQVQVRCRDVGGVAPQRGIAIDVDIGIGHTARRGAVHLVGRVGDHAEAIMDAFAHTAFLWFGTARFRPGELEEDAEAAQALLREADYPAALVRADYDHAEGAGDATLTINVDRGPHLTLEATGNDHFSRAALRRLTTFERNGSVDTVEVESSRAAIVNAYEEAGFYAARVEAELLRQRPGAAAAADAADGAELDADAEGLTVRLQIVEGPRRNVDVVNFVGELPLDRRRIESSVALLTRDHGLLRHPLVRRWLAHDTAAIAALYRGEGYGEVSVRADPQQLPDGRLQVDFVVDAGVRQWVSSVAIDGLPPEVEVDAVRAHLGVAAGRPFEPAALRGAEESVHTALTAAGYLSPEVVVRAAADGAPRPTRVPVTVQVRPGSRARRGGLMVRGARRTRDRVVEHELRLPQGAPLDVPALGAARRRLRALNVFSNVALQPLPRRRGDPEPWLQVRVAEREVSSLDGVLSVSSDDGWAVGADFRDRNLGGNAVNFETELRFANASHVLGRRWNIGQVDRLGSRARAPSPLGLPFDVEAAANYRLEERPLYHLQVLGGSASLLRPLLLRQDCPLCPLVTGRVGYELVQGKYREKVVSPDPLYRGTLKIPSAIIGRAFVALGADRRDAPLDPHRGYAAEARLELALPALARPLFSDGASFWRLLANVQGMLELGSTPLLPLGGERALGGAWVVAAAAQYDMGGAVGHGRTAGVPNSESFAYGGDFSVRGMPPRGSAVAFLGHVMATATVELRWYLLQFGIGTLQLAGFVDLGTVAVVPRQLFDETTVTAGPVVRYVTPVGPLSVAYGLPLARPPSLRGNRAALPPHGRLHVTLGYNF